MNSEHVSKTSVFTMNYVFFPKINCVFQKRHVSQWIMLSFSKTSVFTTNYTPCSFFQKQHVLQWIMLHFYKHISFYNEFYHFETFLAPGGASGGAKPSRAEPSRAEASPSRAEVSRAEPSRAELGRARPSRAEPSQAKPSRFEPNWAKLTRCLLFSSLRELFPHLRARALFLWKRKNNKPDIPIWLVA